MSAEDGDWWHCDGLRVTGVFGGAQPGLRFVDPEQLRTDTRFEEVRRGGYIPEEHVKDMDIDAVDVNILYPTPGVALYRVPDGELLTAICRTYNDWVAEFCTAIPTRLKGIGMLNTDDVPTAVKELERCANLGLVGVMIPIRPLQDRPYDSPVYESLWAAAQDLQIPLSLHTSTTRTGQLPPDVKSLFPSFPPGKGYGASSMDSFVRESLGDMIFGGVFERYPNLKAGSVEVELGWAPFFIRRMDYMCAQSPMRATMKRFKGGALPSDFVHRNVFFSFQEDDLGIRLRDVIGVDNLLWGNDYPHVESTWPRSQQVLEQILAGCNEEEKAKISGGNAARVYRLN